LRRSYATQFMNLADKVLKTDARGRVWTPAEDRERILDELERSGVPATKFAAMVGVKYQTLASWIQKRRKRLGEGAPKAAALSWVEAAVPCAPSSSALVVQLPGGASMAVNDASQAALAGELLRSFLGGDLAC
jgi:transposase-like protein